MTEMNLKQTTNISISAGLIRKLLHRGARSSVAKIFAKAHPFDVARILQILKGYEQRQAFSILLQECSKTQAASVISEMEADESLRLLERLEPRKIADILSDMPADDATSLAAKLPEEQSKQVISMMETETAEIGRASCRERVYSAV